jgi:hypothetical protein
MEHSATTEFALVCIFIPLNIYSFGIKPFRSPEEENFEEKDGANYLRFMESTDEYGTSFIVQGREPCYLCESSDV